MQKNELFFLKTLEKRLSIDQTSLSNGEVSNFKQQSQKRQKKQP